MIDFPCYRVAELLPHSGKMVLLDSIETYSEHGLTASAHIGTDHILLPENQTDLPAYASLEIMAQAVGAWAGIQALAAGEAVRLGFLLGTRKLVLHQHSIAAGSILHVEAVLSWQDQSGMGVFDCTIADKHTGQVIAEAALNVFSPHDGQVLAQLMQ